MARLYVIDLTTYDLEQLALFIAEKSVLKYGYEVAGLALPESLENDISSAKTLYAEKTKAGKRARLKELQARQTANRLRTDTGLADEIAKLEAELK